MTRFLVLVERNDSICAGCVFYRDFSLPCLGSKLNISCEDGIYILVPRPPDGTRCRDLDGNTRVVGVDV